MDQKDKVKILDKVKDNLKAIRAVLDRPVSNDDPVGCTDKLIDLIEIAGLASSTEAKAKYVYESELGEAIERVMQDPETNKLGATAATTIAKGWVANYMSAVTYSERLGRNISHAIDGLRSVISLQKEEIIQSKYGTS